MTKLSPRSYLPDLAIRLSIAAFISILSFWLLVSPCPASVFGYQACQFIQEIIDLPISAFNAVLPTPLQSGYANQFMSAIYESHSPLPLEAAHYMTVGLFPWTVLLYFPLLVKYSIRKLRKTKNK
jgi:hypothetical protein